MKKQTLLSGLMLVGLLSLQTRQTAYSQPCSQPINLITNGDFANGFTGFTSGLTLGTGNCPGNAYNIGTAFDDFCNNFPSTPSGPNMMIVDFNGAGSGTMVLEQPISNVAAGVNYTVSFRGAIRNAGEPVPINIFYDTYSIGTITMTTAQAFANYSINWTAPAGVPANGNFTIRIGSTNAWNDFVLTDLAFTYCAASWRNTYENGKDHNHFSVAEVGNGFAVAGTLYNPSKLEYTTFLVKRFSDVGNVIWEREYDLNSAYDARCFDVSTASVHGREAFVMTGYVQSTSAVSPETFVMAVDANNGTVLDYKQFSLGTYAQSTGLDILYSPTQDELFVAGYQSNDILDVSSDKMGFVLSLDASLNVNWARRISSPATTSDDNMANNLTEIPGEGVFVTGSVNNTPNGNGSVSTLKLLLDYSGGTIWDLTAISSNAYECGVDAVYDRNTDILYVLTNNSAMHTFEIREIEDASTSGPSLTLSGGANNLLQEVGNVAGFSLAFDPHSSDLIVAGMIQDMPESTPGNTPSFIAHVDINSYGVTGLHYIETSNAGYRDHDHDVFQAFTTQQALINYPDILGVLPSNFVVLGYEGLSGYSLSVTRTDATGETPSSRGCAAFVRTDPYATSPIRTAANVTPESAVPTMLQTREAQPSYSILRDCEPVKETGKKQSTGIAHVATEKDAFKIYPNPASTNLQIEIPKTGEAMQVNARIFNSFGQVVTAHTGNYASGTTVQLDVAALPDGIYYLSVEAGQYKINKPVVVVH